jgi:hypothetical protein
MSMSNTGPPPITSPTFRDGSIVTTRPVTVGPMLEPFPPEALTSGYQIDPTAIGGHANNLAPIGKYGKPVLASGSNLALSRIGAPWPNQINSSVKRFTSYIPNMLREVAHVNVRGNYGMVSSEANFLYRHQEYPAASVEPGSGGDYWGGNIAGYPGVVPSWQPPMWNNLVAIIWQLRVLNPTAGGSLNNTVQQAYVQDNASQNPAQFIPAGNASLIFKGENVGG